jgi:hypothetical protein
VIEGDNENSIKHTNIYYRSLSYVSKLYTKLAILVSHTLVLNNLNLIFTISTWYEEFVNLLQMFIMSTALVVCLIANIETNETK